jgi:hypothetical protein
MAEFYLVSALIIVIGVPFVLYWWKFADRWASEEHKRFGRKRASDGREEVVVRLPAERGHSLGPDEPLKGAP